MDDNLCVIPFQGKDYALHPRDITVSKLREFKQKYGAAYGTYTNFVTLFLQGDADAVACAVSIVLAKEGIKRDPNMIEFSPYDIFEALRKANEAREEEERARIAAGEDEEEENPTPSDSDESESTHDGTLT